MYVIRLDERVWDLARMRKRNPDRDPRKPCYYVGHTGVAVEERWRTQKEGRRASPTARKYGLYLTPSKYRKLPVLASRAEAEDLEARHAAELRRQGYGVCEGRLGQVDPGKRSSTTE